MDLETLASLNTDSWNMDESAEDYNRNHHHPPSNTHHQHQEHEYQPPPPRQQYHHQEPPPQTHATPAEEYKVRYNVLRQMYEQRLRGLVTQMHSVYADTTRDAAVQALGDSETTMPFQDLRRQEVIQEVIQSETEHSYRKAAHNLAKTESQLHKANKKIHDLKRQVRQMNEYKHEYEHDLNATRTQLNTTANELEQLKLHKKTSKQKHQQGEQPSTQKGGPNQGEPNDSMLSVNGRYANDSDEEEEEEKADNQPSDPLLVQRLNRMEHLLERVVDHKTVGKGGKKKNNKYSQEQKTNKRYRQRYNTSDDDESSSDVEKEDKEISQYKLEQHPSYVAMAKQVHQVKALLTQSERERLELRSKYIAIGNNVEQLIKTDSIATSEEITRLRSKCTRFKSHISTITKKAKLAVKGCNEKLEQVHVKLKETVEREEELKIQMTAKENEMIQLKIEGGTVASMQDELNRARERVLLLESTIDDATRAENNKLDSIRIEAREEHAVRLTDAEVRCAKLEAELVRVRAEQDERIKLVVNTAQLEAQRRYEVIVERKLNDLKQAHEKTISSHEHAKLTEDTLREQVGQRLKNIAENHIPIEQHSEIIRTKLDTLAAEHDREIAQINVENEHDSQTKLEEQHYQLRAEFNVKEAELQRTLAERDIEIKDLQSSRDTSTNDANEERKVMLSIKESLMEETTVREKMQAHLKEAGMNLTRLKTIVTAERKKRIEAEAKIKEEKDRRRDEEHTMVQELKKRESNHQNDKQLLESSRTQLVRATGRIAQLEEVVEMKTRDVDLCKSRTVELEESLVDLQKKLRTINGLKDDADVLLLRKEKETIELSRQLETAIQSRNESNNNYAEMMSLSKIKLNTEMDDHNQKLLKAQAQYRDSHLSCMQKEDELNAMKDRIQSVQVLAKEREAALVQQLQTYRKTSNDTTTSAEHAFQLQVEHLEHQLKEGHTSIDRLQEENSQLSSELRSSTSTIKQMKEDVSLMDQRLASVNQTNRETVSTLAALRKEQMDTTNALENAKEINHAQSIAMHEYETKLTAADVALKGRQNEITSMTGKIKEMAVKSDEWMDKNVGLEKKIITLESEIKDEEKKLYATNVEHEVDVQKTMKEMEVRYQISEQELRTRIESKTKNLEIAMRRIQELERGGNGGGNGGSNDGGHSGAREEMISELKDQIVQYEYQLNVFRQDKLELLQEIERSRQRTLSEL